MPDALTAITGFTAAMAFTASVACFVTGYNRPGAQRWAAWSIGGLCLALGIMYSLILGGYQISEIVGTGLARLVIGLLCLGITVSVIVRGGK